MAKQITKDGRTVYICTVDRENRVKLPDEIATPLKNRIGQQTKADYDNDDVLFMWFLPPENGALIHTFNQLLTFVETSYCDSKKDIINTQKARRILGQGTDLKIDEHNRITIPTDFLKQFGMPADENKQQKREVYVQGDATINEVPGYTRLVYKSHPSQTLDHF